VEDSVADVAGVAVAEQQMAERIRPGADPPTVQPLAVVRAELEVEEVQPGPARRLGDRAGGEVEQRVEKQADRSQYGSTRPDGDVEN
jgi:hypothetical protein